MKLFICWSGNRSLQFAQATAKWLSRIFGDRVSVTLSVNIEKGAVWFEELSEALREARLGIMCLTPEAVHSPWIHFEAGLLAKTLHEQVAMRLAPRQAGHLRIFPFLNGVEPGTLAGSPLSAYQTTSATDRDDAWRLIEAVLTVIGEDVAAAGEAGIAPPQRKNVHIRFLECWDSFQADLREIKPASLAEIMPDFERFFARKTFNESMYDCLGQGWLDRHNGARDVYMELRQHRQTVRKACRRYIADMFDMLLFEVDAYAMCLAVLLGRGRMPIGDNGQLTFEERGVAVACERRRRAIKNLVARMADERQAPFFEEAFTFESAETLAERKRLLNRKAAEIRRDKQAIQQWMDEESDTGIEKQHNSDRCRDSEWDLDRLVYYIWKEDTPSRLDVQMELRCFRGELERVISGVGDPFLLALHHALRTLRLAAARPPEPVIRDEIVKLLARTLDVVRGVESEIACEIRQTVADLQLTLGQPTLQFGAAGTPGAAAV